MIHPSYTELIQKINSESGLDEEHEINSRYSIVIAAAKRARQIIDGAEPRVQNDTGKPLSIAVDELYSGDVKIMGEDDEPEDDIPDDHVEE